MATLGQDPAEGSRSTVERNLNKQSGKGGPENAAGAAKATEDNDLTTGHSQPGDGGDANSKKKAG